MNEGGLMKNFTIKDIAKALNVSISTVSRALHDRPEISEETKIKVQDFAQKVNYQPNYTAQSLISKKSKLVGVLVPNIRDLFFSSAISAIENFFHEQGYAIIVLQSNEKLEKEINALNALVSYSIAGIVIAVSQETKNPHHIEKIVKGRIPAVFFDRVPEGINYSQVTVDDENGAFQAVEYLIQSGYHRIAYINGPEHLLISQKRILGYQKALKENGLKPEPQYIFSCGLSSMEGKKAIEKIMQSSHPPDAVFCVNDPVAFGVYQYIQQNQLTIPKDLAVIGFSDDPIGKVLVPELTTVHQPVQEMARKASEILMEEINDAKKENKIKKIVLETKLIVRKST